jgi:hypothetical protein
MLLFSFIDMHLSMLRVRIRFLPSLAGEGDHFSF